MSSAGRERDAAASPQAPPAPSISSRTLQTLDPCVILMKQIISQHADKWEDDPRGIFSLAQGVVHWRPPDAAYEALSEALRDDDTLLHTYCPDEGYPPLLAALRDKLRRENGLDDPHVVVTSGANQAFVNCVLTFLDERDRMGNVSKCVVFAPYYFNHVMAVQGARGEGGLLVGPTDRGVPDLAWLRSQLEENAYGGEGEGGNAIRMVTLVNPGNPTGVSLPRAFLEEVVALTREHGVWLVMDNTYEHFDVRRRNRLPDDAAAVGEDDDAPDFPCFDEGHVVNIFSFSKGYAMAGFRVGYVALSSRGGGPAAYEEMLKVQDTIAICASRPSQVAALGALRAGRDWVRGRVATLEDGRAAILDAVASLEEVVGGDGAMYVMGKLPDGTDDREFASALVERHGVAVIPGSFCGAPGWIRVCYSNLPPEDCEIAAARLKKGISELTANSP